MTHQTKKPLTIKLTAEMHRNDKRAFDRCVKARSFGYFCEAELYTAGDWDVVADLFTHE